METRVHYTIVGLFVLIVATVTLVAGVWLSAGLQSKSYDTYEILMYEPVSGLSEQAPVKYNGVQVGFVKSVDLNDDNPSEVVLMVQIEQGTPITQGTVATLMSQGITGVTYIGLKTTASNAPLLKKRDGASYIIIPSAPSLLVQLDSALRDLSSNFNGVAKSLQTLLNEDNLKVIHDGLSHLDHLLAVMDKDSTGFAQTLKNLSSAADNASAFFNTGTYAIQQWSNQVIPSTFGLVSQFGRLAADLQQITNELKQQPSLLIRGRVSPPLGPGEQPRN